MHLGCLCIQGTFFRKHSEQEFLQCVAVCCSMLQCVAMRCSALQCVAVGILVVRKYSSSKHSEQEY